MMRKNVGLMEQPGMLIEQQEKTTYWDCKFLFKPQPIGVIRAFYGAMDATLTLICYLADQWECAFTFSAFSQPT